MDDPASLKSRELLEKYHDEFSDTFAEGMKKYKMTDEEARDLFEKFLQYSFNKGHAVGYALISLEEMYNKVYHPNEFWYTKLKQIDLDKKGDKFLAEIVKEGIVVFLPHVNYSYDFSLRKIEGENVIQMGYKSIKGVGEKAAIEIEAERRQNGIFTSFDDFYDRCKSRVVNERVVKVLRQEGALEFDKDVYINRVKKYNSSLYSRAQ